MTTSTIFFSNSRNLEGPGLIHNRDLRVLHSNKEILGHNFRVGNSKSVSTHQTIFFEKVLKNMFFVA